MCKETGVPRFAGTAEARKAQGLAIWEEGDIFRPGKTRRDRETGVQARYLQNKEARRDEHKRRAGTTK